MFDLVTLNKDNKPTTTSKILADRFHKVHRDVVRAINNLDIPEDFRVRNFAQSKFKADNINGLEYDCYEMTRDGFTLLAMGFTGKKAMEWKVKFIEAFNRMEATISKMATVPSLTQDRAALKAIGGIVKKCAAVAVREEVAKIMTSSSDTTEPWEISDTYLMQVLHDWHLTRNKTDVVKMQELIRQNEEYKRRLSAIKQAVI